MLAYTLSEPLDFSQPRDCWGSSEGSPTFRVSAPYQISPLPPPPASTLRSNSPPNPFDWRYPQSSLHVSSSSNLSRTSCNFSRSPTPDDEVVDLTHSPEHTSPSHLLRQRHSSSPTLLHRDCVPPPSNPPPANLYIPMIPHFVAGATSSPLYPPGFHPPGHLQLHHPLQDTLSSFRHRSDLVLAGRESEAGHPAFSGTRSPEDENLYLSQRGSMSPRSHERSSKAKKVPHCSKCRNHGLTATISGHRERCPMKDCRCVEKGCNKIDDRRADMKIQQRKRRLKSYRKEEDQKIVQPEKKPRPSLD